jgi:hypothetical protein
MSASQRSYLTIVSGLPRSGTSLMMKMLEAGGMPVVIDDVRTADVDNPRGYYEYEPVKQTKSDPSWIEPALGKAVKMVYLLLLDLPADRDYRVLFMRRTIDEILASQTSMLRRLGKSSPMDDETMAALFRDQLRKFDDWVRNRSHIRLIDVDYNALIADPRPSAIAVDAFLDGGLDIDAMTRIVDPSLYRNRSPR